MNPSTSLSALADAGVVAVLRAPSAQAAVDAVGALVDGGVHAIEITYSTPDVPTVLSTLAERYGDRIVLGAGTVLSAAQAGEAVRAGATFLVSPGTDDEVAAAMVESGALTMLGAVTPTEIMRAMRLGAHVVKVFPGNLVGPGYLRALRGPFPDVPLMPTGGVSAANVGEWLAAGAVAVGAGGELASGADIRNGDWGAIRDSARRFVAAMSDARAAAAAA